MRGELERKGSDYDQLLERVTELQQVRVQLENELAPLRAERANILHENATLRESSDPEKYLQLKSNYTKLSDECVKLQKRLTEESRECEQLRKGLADEVAINTRMGEANRELLTQLEATTDERGLQAIRDRMEQYRGERDQLKQTVSQYQERDQEQQQTIHSLQVALEEVVAQHSHQDSTGVWQEQLASLRAQLEDSNKRMLRYREERNMAKIMLKSLQEQISTLQATVDQLQNSRSYDAYPSGQLDTALLTKLQLTDDSAEMPATGSPHEEAYSPEESDQTAPGLQHQPSSSSSTRNFSPSGGGGGGAKLYTEVMTKDGVMQSLIIERPRNKLNHRVKPEVIVKRKGGQFETGVLAFAGVLDGKEMAGVILDLPSISSCIIIHNSTNLFLHYMQLGTMTVHSRMESTTLDGECLLSTFSNGL